MSKILNHITDLHLLNDDEVAQFAAELPGIVASLRVAATAAQAEGLTLAQAFPNITFVPELKDATVYRAGDKTLEVSHRDVQRADQANQAQAMAASVIAQASAKYAPTQDELNQELFNAAKQGSLVGFKMLLERGADINAKTAVRTIGGVGTASKHGDDSVLHVAAENGSDEVCAAILACGIDVNVRNAQGHTPLYSATRASHRTTALFLVSRGADTRHFADPEGGSEGFKNEWPLRVGSTDFKGMSMHTATIRLGDFNRLSEILADPAHSNDSDFLKGLIKTAKSAKRPDMVAFLNAKAATDQIETIRRQAGKRP